MRRDLPRVTQLVSEGWSQNSNTGLSNLQISVPFTVSEPLKLKSASESVSQCSGGQRKGLMSHIALPKPQRIPSHLPEWVWISRGFYLMIIRVILAQICNPT